MDYSPGGCKLLIWLALTVDHDQHRGRDRQTLSISRSEESVYFTVRAKKGPVALRKTSIEQVEKALGEPFAMDFSDYVRKIRNGLIFTSVVSISLLLGGLEISEESSLLGLKFHGLNNELVLKVLFSITLYLFLHFLWCSIDSFQEWWLRLSGTRVAHVTTAIAASEHGDYPNDPRQSTLYNWWKNEARQIGSFSEPLHEIEEKLKSWEETVKVALEGKDPNVMHSCTAIRNVAEDIRKLSKAVENSCKVIESQRIPVSLKRFDLHFIVFLRSQNLRWLVIELGFPLLISGYALFILWQSL